MPYKPGPRGSFPWQPRRLARGIPSSGSAVDRDVPLGFKFSKSRRNRSWGILEPVESICSSMRGMTSVWPSGPHFSPRVKYTYAARDGKLGSSFLTWFPTPSFQICWTRKKSLCRQPSSSAVFPFSALAKSIPCCGAWKGGRGWDGFSHRTYLRGCRLLQRTEF